MVAVLDPPENPAKHPAQKPAAQNQHPERFVVLESISWETYRRLLSEHPDSAGPRFTYDEGRLQIMTLEPIHEEANRTLAQLVEMVAEEMEIELRRFGSTTFDREDLSKGFEPDSCYYIQRLDAIGRKREIDISVDPPPDLVIEIDISSDSLNKFPIFASVGVPEVWRYDGKAVTIFELQEGEYVKAAHSLALPLLDSETATRFMSDSENIGSNAWKRSVRNWVRAQLETKDE